MKKSTIRRRTPRQAAGRPLTKRERKVRILCTECRAALAAIDAPRAAERAAALRPPVLCDMDCNSCDVIRNRQVSLTLAILREVFGEEVCDIVNRVCPNLTCCADCRIDDFCHLGDDDGNPICEIELAAKRFARQWKRRKCPGRKTTK